MKGSILFNGRPFDPVNDILQIGYMPEERGLYKKMKIGEQAVYLARLKGHEQAGSHGKSKGMVCPLRNAELVEQKVEDLSKGMSQKLQFVTTVLHDPKLHHPR